MAQGRSRSLHRPSTPLKNTKPIADDKPFDSGRTEKFESEVRIYVTCPYGWLRQRCKLAAVLGFLPHTPNPEIARSRPFDMLLPASTMDEVGMWRQAWVALLANGSRYRYVVCRTAAAGPFTTFNPAGIADRSGAVPAKFVPASVFLTRTHSSSFREVGLYGRS
jgi:hypothetical protein